MPLIQSDHIIAAKVWWAFTWRSTVFSVLIAALLGVLLVLLTMLLGMSPSTTDFVSARFGPLIGMLVYCAVSIDVMRRILKKKFSEFELAIIARREPPSFQSRG